jgi:hypothetical protein
MREKNKKFEDNSNYKAKKTNFTVENNKAISKIGRLPRTQATYTGFNILANHCSVPSLSLGV